MGIIVTLGMSMASKRALATVKYYGGKLGNTLPMFASYGPPYAGNFGKVTGSRGRRAARLPLGGRLRLRLWRPSSSGGLRVAAFGVGVLLVCAVFRRPRPPWGACGGLSSVFPCYARVAP